MKQTELTPHERERAYKHTFTQIEQDTEQYLCNGLERFHESQYEHVNYHIGLYPEIWDRKPVNAGYVWFLNSGKEWENKEERLNLLAEAIIEIGLIIKGF